MKNILLAIASAFTFGAVSAQQMHVKQFNFTTFHKQETHVPALLVQQSSKTAQQHPEFGLRPFNAQCNECVELIDSRTIDSRFFIDPEDAGHTYSQKSYLPLHYKKQGEAIWRTIDHRLSPVAGKPGVYQASNQPTPTICDLNRKTTTLDVGEMKFEFNKDLTMYFFDEDNVYSAHEKGDYTTYTIGQEGLEVKEIWPGMKMQQIFRAGEIETEYVIDKPLQLPITKGWMVVEDHFTLPGGYTFEEATPAPVAKATGLYRGDYHLKNAKGEVLLAYEKPVYLDARAYGQDGDYKLIRNGNDYTLQMYIPVSWFNKAGNVYPLLIDPVVGNTKLGDFRSAGLPSASLGFSSLDSVGCDYHMNVNVPGGGEISNVYVDLEYQLTYDNTCGNPPLPAPYCTFSQVSMEVISDSCGISTGRLTCKPAQPPYTGTCTTDSALVLGAKPIKINSFVPNFLSCYPFFCEQYRIPFTLRNKDSICGDRCGYLCARGNMWQMTVEATGDYHYITVSQDKDWVCIGDSVTFTAYPGTEPAPHVYVWEYGPDGGPKVIDTTSSNKITLYPTESLRVKSYLFIPCDSLQKGKAHAYDMYVSINYTPTPGILVFGDTLKSAFVSEYLTYQWYINGVAIPSANDSIYITTWPGSYTLTTKYDGACTSLPSSAVFITGVKEINKLPLITIYPNPASTELFISTNNLQALRIQLFDAAGRKVMEQKFSNAIDISKLIPGVYLIEVIGDDTTLRKQFVKQ